MPCGSTRGPHDREETLRNAGRQRVFPALAVALVAAHCASVDPRDAGVDALVDADAEVPALAVLPTNPRLTIGVRCVGQPIDSRPLQFSAELRTGGAARMLSAGEVSWASDNEAVATIDSGGVASGASQGRATISARLRSDPRVVGTTGLEVSVGRLFCGLAISPSNPSVAVGASQAFTAIGHYGDGQNVDATAHVQWSSSDPAVATIGPDGIAHGVAPGATTIRATDGPIASNAATLAVIAP